MSCACNERRLVNLKFCLVDVAALIQELCDNCFILVLNRQNPRDRTFNLPFYFRCKYISSLESHLSCTRREFVPLFFQATLRPCLSLSTC